MIKRLKEINNKHKEWIKGRGYKYYKPLVIGFLIISFLLLGVVAFVDGFKPKVWVSCPSYGSPCVNPLKELNCDSYCCDLDYIAPGTSCGEKTSWLGLNYSWLVFLLFVVVLLLNHFIFNKGYDFNRYWGDFK
jgi:hypothetical protein